MLGSTKFNNAQNFFLFCQKLLALCFNNLIVSPKRATISLTRGRSFM